MTERRKASRQRTLFGGSIIFNKRGSTMDCVVRNFSAEGAKLVFTHTVAVPDEFELAIKQKARSYRVRVIWRHADEAGVAILDQADPAELLPVEWVRRLRTSETEKAKLQKRVEDLSRGY